MHKRPECDGFLDGMTKSKRDKIFNALTDNRIDYTYHGETFCCIRDWIRKVIEVDDNVKLIIEGKIFLLAYTGEYGLYYYKL